MRLADIVLRRGHLSEDALVEIWSTGMRPAHLDQCDICAERATEMSRWLEDVQDLGRAEADAAFPEKRLVAQRDQVLRRLAFLDRPAKVISFPARSTRSIEAGAGRGVSPGWLAAAAAAGLLLGVSSVELRDAIWPGSDGTQEVVASTSAQMGESTLDASPLFDDPYSQPEFGPAFGALAEMTPRLIDVSVTNR